ncbi:MAG: alanine racemase [Spirochaetia bacterium]
MRATRALVHLGNLRKNIGLIRKHTGGRPMICLALKADAYGHGIVGIGREAAATGVDYFAVATVDEAVELRNAGLTIPVLLYSLPTPDEIPEIVEHDVIPVVSDEELADLLEAEAKRRGRVITVHLKIDTGMGRIGCTPEAAPSLAADLAARSNLTLGGISTHFATSDSADPTPTRKQIQRFDTALRSIRRSGIDPGIVHAGNSGGILAYPEAWYDMIRPGILAFGYFPSDEQPRELEIRPVMDLRSRLVFIKEVQAGTPVSYGSTWRATQRTYIGTIPVGYGDGYNRLLSNRGRVVIRGASYPIVGRVCMDHIMVNLGSTCSVERFDDVLLFGPDPGAPDAEELSRICRTIPYEITCTVSKRVPRLYVE